MFSRMISPLGGSLITPGGIATLDAAGHADQQPLSLITPGGIATLGPGPGGARGGRVAHHPWRDHPCGSDATAPHAEPAQPAKQSSSQVRALSSRRQQSTRNPAESPHKSPPLHRPQGGALTGHRQGTAPRDPNIARVLRDSAQNSPTGKAVPVTSDDATSRRFVRVLRFLRPLRG